MQRSFTFILSLFALIILIIIQIYVISNYYNLKSKNFDYIYSRGILNAIKTSDYDMSSDTLNRSLDNLALSLILESYNDSTYFHDVTIRNKNLHLFDSLLNRFETNTVRIKKYTSENDMDTLFKSHYIIREISLLNSLNLYNIYQSNDSIIPKEKGMFINSYYKEGNYYVVRYDYYIDFTKKHRIILSEMKSLLIIVLLTLFIVITAFSFTHSALYKQKKLSEIKGDFIDNITHEFKTPLSTISVAISSLKLPQIKENDDKYNETLKTLEKQNWYLTEMISHVIDVSLLERKAALPDKKELLLKPYLNETIKTFLDSNPGKKISISENYSIQDDYSYRLDQVQFTRVINNLLSNSVKYCLSDPEISITASINKQLVLVFNDNGIGINEEYQKDVFNKFYRAENSIKTKGLGLGLYIVKKIIENHQGTIQLISRPNAGTRIIISLPV